eukprot:3054829-Lingulodinium_polyedra.AAC.1
MTKLKISGTSVRPMGPPRASAKGELSSAPATQALAVSPQYSSMIPRSRHSGAPANIMARSMIS